MYSYKLVQEADSPKEETSKHVSTGKKRSLHEGYGTARGCLDIRVDAEILAKRLAFYEALRNMIWPSSGPDEEPSLAYMGDAFILEISSFVDSEVFRIHGKSALLELGIMPPQYTSFRA